MECDDSARWLPSAPRNTAERWEEPKGRANFVSTMLSAGGGTATGWRERAAKKKKREERSVCVPDGRRESAAVFLFPSRVSFYMICA